MLDLNTEIKEALRKGKSKIHIKGQEYTLNDAIKMNTYMNGGYKKYQTGGGAWLGQKTAEAVNQSRSRLSDAWSNMQYNLGEGFSDFAFQNPFENNYSIFGSPSVGNINPTDVTTDITQGIAPAPQGEMLDEYVSKSNWIPQEQTGTSKTTNTQDDYPRGQIGIEKNPNNFDPFQKSVVHQDVLNPLAQETQKTADVIREDEEEDTKTETQTFNPYAGVDIPSAAAFLGQSIESGNTLMGVASGLKLGLGVTRNILGGMGRERTVQDQRDFYRDRQKEKMEGQPRYSASQENGGYFEMGGIMPAPMQAAYQGREDKDGGLSEEKVLTGEFMQGVSPNNEAVQPNSELEDGEHIYSQDGSSIKVEGKDHEQGGEEMELQEGDRVISNNLKLKGEGAKRLKQDFDVKVKAKDTYASAVDKIYNSIGLSKIIKEEEEVLGKIKNIEEEVKDETTRNLNSEFLYKKLKDIQSKKEELEPLRQQALETVFNLQEASKPKEEQTENEMFKDGGVKQLSERYNIPIERAQQLIEEFKNGGYKKYQDGGKFEFKSGDTSYEVDIKDVNDAKEAQKLITQIENIRKDAKVGAKVSELPKEYSDAVTSLENIVKKYNEDVDIQRALAGEMEVPGGKKGKDTLVTNQIYGENNANAFYGITLNEEDLSDTTSEVEGDSEDDDKKDKNILDIPLTPDQGVLPPSGMASQLDVQRRYDRVDPKLMSPDAIVEENNRQAQAAIAATADLPDSQRAAAIGQINSQLQQKNSQAISQVEMQNAQIQNQAEAQNIQVQANEENARATDALSYEQRQQTAQALTEENVRQFYDYLRKNNNARFNETVTRNALNQYDENFSIDSLGNVIKTGKAPSKEDFQQTYTLAQVQNLLGQQQAQKKYGGKYKNKK